MSLGGLLVDAVVSGAGEPGVRHGRFSLSLEAGAKPDALPEVAADGVFADVGFCAGDGHWRCLFLLCCVEAGALLFVVDIGADCD